jgi:serine/threonine-protein kinase RsbW
MTESATAAVDLPDVVTVRIPASGAYLSVLRTATAGLAARLDFTLDDIEDLRIAVDEACAMLLVSAVAGTDLTCEFELDGEGMRVSVAVLTRDGELPRRDTFAWTVLTALAGGVDAHVDAENRVTIDLHKQRAGGAAA